MPMARNIHCVKYRKIGFMRVFSIFIIIFIILIGVSFALLNGQAVTVKYYLLGTTEKPLSFVIAIAFVVGIIFGLLANLLGLIRVKIENRRLNKRLKFSDEELTKLRLLTIEDQGV